MPAFLVPVDANQSLIPLEKAIVLIGRQSDCDVSLTNSRKISRKHCCIAQVNDTLIVRDLGSTNGVFLNGTRIEKEAKIVLGDEITIGDIRFTLRNEVPASAKGAATKGGPSKNTKASEKPTGSPKNLPPIPPSIPASSRNKPSLVSSSAELNLKFDEESSDDHPIPPRSRR